MSLYKAPTDNFVSTTLNGAINDSVDTITLNDASKMQAPGYIIIDREDGNGTATPTAREVVYFTGKSSNDLTGCTRAADNSTARSHSDGALVEAVMTVGMWNGVYSAITASMLDTSGNETLKFITTASAVNELTLANAATGNSPVLSATGGDTNIGLDIKAKGSGKFRKPTVVGLEVFSSATNTATGDGKRFFRVPAELNGMNLTGVAGTVYTAGTTNTTDIQIRNKTDSVDMLSTKLTIDSGETDSSTAATPAVIDATKDDVVTGDVLAVDVDAISTTAAQGLYVELRFELPA